jgi:uncharacterized damage-inducible protein DinB
MKRSIWLVLLVVLVGVSASLIAQMPAAQAPAASAQAPTDPIATALKNGFDGISRNVSESAAKMPEADFAFKPTKDVRSFGEILGHIANTHYSLCAAVKGEKKPDAQDFEKITAKSDMVKGLNDSIDYCKAAYASMTDARLLQPVPPPAPATPPAAGQPAPRPTVPFNRLMSNLTHDWEHYGNLVTYLRLKGLVPPSTERAQAGRGRGGD